MDPSENKVRNKGWANLKPHKKGDPPGPGRPKGRTIVAEWTALLDEPMRKLLEKESHGQFKKSYINKKISRALAEVALKKALAGDVQFLKQVMDYLYGRPAQKMDVTSGGQVVKVVGIPMPEVDDE
jgi:hypothetical protein